MKSWGTSLLTALAALVVAAGVHVAATPHDSGAAAAPPGMYLADTDWP